MTFKLRRKQKGESVSLLIRIRGRTSPMFPFSFGLAIKRLRYKIEDLTGAQELII